MKKSLKRLEFPQQGNGSTAQKYFVTEEASGYRSSVKIGFKVNARIADQFKSLKDYPE